MEEKYHTKATIVQQVRMGNGVVTLIVGDRGGQIVALIWLLYLHVDLLLFLFIC